MHTFTLNGRRWHEAYPHFLAPDISRISGLITSSLTQATRVCMCVCARVCVKCSVWHMQIYVCECLSTFNEAPQTGLIEPLVHHWTPHSSDAGQCAPPLRTTEGQTLLIRWQKQMHLFQTHQTLKTQSDEHWSQMVCCEFVDFCTFRCMSLPILMLGCMCLLCVCLCMCRFNSVCERVRALWGQWEVQCVRGLGARALWFHSLAAWRISSPVSQCWAHAEQGEPRQENLCWCQQWKHHNPSTTSHNICQTAVCPFFLSLPSFSSFSPNISILTDIRFWNLEFVLVRGFTLPVACCLYGDFGNTALYWSPLGLGKFGGVFKGAIHTFFFPWGPVYGKLK